MSKRLTRKDAEEFAHDLAGQAGSVTDAQILAWLKATNGRPIIQYFLVRAFREALRMAWGQHTAAVRQSGYHDFVVQERQEPAKPFGHHTEELRRLVAHLNTAVYFYESWRLPNGVLLMDATRQDLEGALRLAERQAHIEAARTNLYRSLVQRTADGQTVRSCVTHEEMLALLAVAPSGHQIALAT